MRCTYNPFSKSHNKLNASVSVFRMSVAKSRALLAQLFTPDAGLYDVVRNDDSRNWT